jgi:VRR-NUC domain-containing protein
LGLSGNDGETEEGDGMSEAVLLKEILLDLGSRPGIRLFRNTTGVGVGLKHKGTISFGLCIGSSDIIGWSTREVYIEEVEGSSTYNPYPFARFVALEVKTDIGRLKPEQAAFLEAVRRAGGIAACVRSVAEARAALGVGA